MFEIDGVIVTWFVNSYGYVEYSVFKYDDGGVTDLDASLLTEEEIEGILREELS